MTSVELEDVEVEAYMATDVDTAGPEMWVTDVVEQLKERSQYGGLPVTNEAGRLLGIVGAIDLVEVPGDVLVEDVMSREPVVVRPEMSVKDAAHIIFRTGHQFLPVVDESTTLVGIFSNGDAIRSQITRTTPATVKETREMLERLHDISIDVTEREVPVPSLIPTQRAVYADELTGREYELREDFAEPIVVVAYGSETFIVDGHHRALAAWRLDVDRILAYVLTVPRDEVSELGLRRTARLGGLRSLADITVKDTVDHPLVERIEPVQ